MASLHNQSQDMEQERASEKPSYLGEANTVPIVQSVDDGGNDWKNEPDNRLWSGHLIAVIAMGLDFAGIFLIECPKEVEQFKSWSSWSIALIAAIGMFLAYFDRPSNYLDLAGP
ncbi:hypothetical protein NW762_004194 [Fusarium torreyae]|uniref:Uncharacterized protein n=1 Tax=Fusarium torreyae TaxID=1237075 RepID=A0A9W8S8I4_9HYPO|nr:hypothetical protein NW762_004194 [Fusarium torreyae]